MRDGPADNGVAPELPRWICDMRQKDRSDAVIGIVSGAYVSRVVTNDLDDAVRDGKPILIINTALEPSKSMSSYLDSKYLPSTQIITGNDSKKLAGEISISMKNMGKVY